jgi:hypothetical protein
MGVLKALPLEKPGACQALKLFDEGNELISQGDGEFVRIMRLILPA